MTEDSKKLINNFLIKDFNIKKIKNNFGKWVKAIYITEGYIRKDVMIYKWVGGIQVSLVAADLITIITNVFGCTTKESTEIVLEFIKTLPTQVLTHNKVKGKPKKY